MAALTRFLLALTRDTDADATLRRSLRDAACCCATTPIADVAAKPRYAMMPIRSMPYASAFAARCLYAYASASAALRYARARSKIRCAL